MDKAPQIEDPCHLGCVIKLKILSGEYCLGSEGCVFVVLIFSFSQSPGKGEGGCEEQRLFFRTGGGTCPGALWGTGLAGTPRVLGSLFPVPRGCYVCVKKDIGIKFLLVL